MRKRILFLIPNMSAGGAERVVTTLLRHLDRTMFEPMLGIADRTRDQFAHLIPEDVPVFDLKGPRVRYALRHAVALIWRQRPDVVISTLDHMNLALALSRPLWPRGSKCALRVTSGYTAKHPIRRMAMPLLFRLADVLIYQSKAMKALFERELPLSSVTSVVLNNPVDIPLIRQSAAEEPGCVGGQAGMFNIVSVGRLYPIKGFDIAIEAMALLRDDPITLTIVGEGESDQDLAALIRKRGLEDRVKLAGYRPNPYPMIRQADALLLPSRYEGFPNVVLEALALGTPVIATPVAGVPELLAGLPGCASAADISPGALAAAMRDASRRRARLSSDVLAAYSAENATRAYEDVFKRLADGQLERG